MLIHYVFHIWFKIVRSACKRYRLSVNCILVLNGAYIYNKVHGKPFARTQLLKFVTYFNNHKIGVMMTVLISKGYIIESGKYKQHITYVISPLGIQVIELLNKSYEEELYSFCSKYSIEL
jgi:hypothetical protein